MNRYVQSFRRVTVMWVLCIVACPPAAAAEADFLIWLLDEGAGDVAVGSGSMGYHSQDMRRKIRL